jgi:tricorn protease-like protein
MAQPQLLSERSSRSSRSLVLALVALLVIGAGYVAAFSLLDPFGDPAAHEDPPTASGATFGPAGVPLVHAYVGDELVARVVGPGGPEEERRVRAPEGVHFVAATVPVYSPDSSRVAFVGQASRRPGAEDNLALWVMDVGGGAARKLTDLGSEVSDLAFSPDGRRIAFTDREGLDGDENVFVVGVDGSDRRRVTENPATERAPAFSPDGTRIAYTSDRDGNAEIYAADLAGGAAQRLTRSPADERTPAFSPDGARIAYAAAQDAGARADIHTMDADGGDDVKLTSSPGVDSAPRYSPDGGRILFLRDSGRDSSVHIMTADGAADTVVAGLADVL